MCRQELKWALEAAKPIVPVCSADDKKRISEFIAEAKTYGLDFGALNFVHIDRSGYATPHSRRL